MDQWPGEEKELACLRLILSYVTDTVKASFKREITELAVIPGGLTSLLQPLDVSLNKPFEDEVRKQWMADGIHEFTATERQKKASEGTDLFVDFASVESHSVRNDRYLFP